MVNNFKMYKNDILSRQKKQHFSINEYEKSHAHLKSMQQLSNEDELKALNHDYS
jgi:hypothetical protein